MDKTIRSALCSQFLTALAQLEITVNSCPPDLWRARLRMEDPLKPENIEFWDVISHTLFAADQNLSGGQTGSDAAVSLSKETTGSVDAFSRNVSSKDDLLRYTAHCRRKARSCISALTDEKASRVVRLRRKRFTYFELLLDTIRHIQEHAAQLNLYLGQARRNPTRRVSLDQ